MPVSDRPGNTFPPRPRRLAPVVSAITFAAGVLFWGLPGYSAAEPRRSTPVLEFDIASQSETGLLDPGQAFMFSVRLKGLTSRGDAELVAIFESLAFPDRLVAFTSDDESAELAASTKIEPKPIAAGQPLRMDVVVARLRGMRLETVLKRTVYLTVAPLPGPSDAAASTAPASTLMDAFMDQAYTTDRAGQPVRPLLPPDQIAVEELGGGPPAVQGPPYWKKVTESVARHWQQRRAQLRRDQARRGLRVRFRLYPRGYAQLIQIERSSGDPTVDEAGMRTVLSLHPFPPFPSDVHEPSVDVHVDLPGSRR